jgi:hypothetical protein
MYQYSRFCQLMNVIINTLFVHIFSCHQLIRLWPSIKVGCRLMINDRGTAV